jgi:hypothetical protein
MGKPLLGDLTMASLQKDGAISALGHEPTSRHVRVNTAHSRLAAVTSSATLDPGLDQGTVRSGVPGAYGRPVRCLGAMEDRDDVNTGTEWSAIDLVDFRYSIERSLTVAEIACFLRRTEAEVREKAAELGVKLE